jgi:hypothetical protein
MQGTEKEKLIRQIKNKKVLTDADIEILAEAEHARFFPRVE